ncbi:hypothetical protein Gohar_015823 [Gossypium harknessii]|uniref:Uncharacterized protein n=1 Tax=Gossypium harknessii TaxID=34285 RepID=A0A7J9G1F6_9ROSI|nr:hypothetical protein [Gossypium harknessii]
MFLVGSLPDFHKSSSFVSLRLANTGLSGLLPESIGNLQSLSVLDVSYFSFSGKSPNSLANLTELTALLLYGNQFSNQIPSCQNELEYLNLSGNKIHGVIPKWIWDLSLRESFLQATTVPPNSTRFHLPKQPTQGRNLIRDMQSDFYNCLASRVESCHQRHNGFHGAMGSPKSNEFPELRNIDLSFNEFVGRLASLHFQRWNAMQVVDGLIEMEKELANLNTEDGEEEALILPTDGVSRK